MLSVTFLKTIFKMATGKIKFFNRKKGFGFIIEDDTLREVFVHASGITNKKLNFKPEDKVQFDVMDDADGKTKAINVDKMQE